MIKRFKPEDFEECLMSLPIDNWKFVDSEEYYKDDSKEMSRPKMMISHLEELKGIVHSERLLIKAFTEVSVINEDKKISEAFKYVLNKAQEANMTNYKTLGCLMVNHKEDPDLYPYLTAVDSELTMKSYIKERRVDFREYVGKEHKTFLKNNELVYELVMENIEFDFFQQKTVAFENEHEEVRFSYFLGYLLEDDRIKTFRYAIMLPNKRVIRCSRIEGVMKDHPLDLDDHSKTMIKRIFYEELKKLRLSVSQKVFTDQVFEELIWKEIKEATERRKLE